MMDRIVSAFDAEITEALLKELKKKGITFLLSSQVTAVSEKNVSYKKDDETFEIPADKVLCSIGRVPVIENIGLDNLNIYTAKGAIVTDDNMSTNISGIYAVGDVNGKYMLAHTAYREAEVAVNHILGKHDKMRYHAVPSVIYTYPEVACVGMTEEQAKEDGREVKSVSISLKYSGRYLAEVDRGNGFCKIIIDTKRDYIVGVHMIGSYVSEIIYGVTHMIEAKTPIDSIKETIFPHPTVCEVIREALFL
jgi:dihydrolipoamide dehydrogenase